MKRKGKITDIFKKYINEEPLFVIFKTPQEQEEIVTVLEHLGYHFETKTPLREVHFQNDSQYRHYSFWGGKNVAIGAFDVEEEKNWYRKPVIMRYEDYHPLYLQILATEGKQSVFPVITEGIQTKFEAACHGILPQHLPMICGVYGRACRQMGKEEGANRFTCCTCPLKIYAEKEKEHE